MNDKIKAALITLAIFLGMWLFVWLCIVTEGWAAVVLLFGAVFIGIYALVYGIITGRIDDW